MSGDRRTNARKNVKSVERLGSIVRPPCVQPAIVMVTSTPVTALSRVCLSDGTHGPAPINAVACPESRDHPPTNTDSGNRGNPRQQDGCLTKRYPWICLFLASLFGIHRFADMFLISVSMSLSLFSPSACAVATIRCLYNEIVSHRPKYTHVFYPVRGHQIMINATAQ